VRGVVFERTLAGGRLVNETVYTGTARFDRDVVSVVMIVVEYIPFVVCGRAQAR
jgi:hypothetical protein